MLCALRHALCALQGKEFVVFKNYFKVFVRNLVKYKTYSSINILGLALGIAVCLMISLYVVDELSYDRCHSDASRIFRIVLDVQTATEKIQYATTPTSLKLALRQDFPQVEQAVRLMTNPEIMIGAGADKKFSESRVFHTDPEIFQLFTLPFIEGDPHTCLNRPRTVVITETIARKYFGDQNALGQSLDFGYAQFGVTGVIKDIPAKSHLKFDFLLSLTAFNPKDWQQAGWENIDGQQGLIYTYVKLVPNCNIKAFENQIKYISAKYPGGMKLKAVGETHQYSLQPIADIHLHSHRRNEIETPGNALNITIFSLIAGLVLIIACLNFINLTTARATNRLKEVGLRQALGASRLQMMNQFLSESILLSLIALLLALIMVEIALPGFNTLSDKQLGLNLFSDPTRLIMSLVIVVFVGLVAGSYPAFFLVSFRPARIFRGNLIPGISGSSLRKVLVICQFTASVILIVGTLVVYQQLRFMKNSNLGFDKDRLLILPVPVGSLFDKNSVEMIRNEFTNHHEILAATTTSYIPGMHKNLFQGQLKLMGDGTAQDYPMNIMMVDPDFFRTYAIEVIAGRAFQSDRPVDIGATCLINEAAVKTLGWQSPEQAIGIRLFDFEERKIIGVFKDFHFRSLQHPIEPLFLGINPDFYVYLTLKFNTQNLSALLSFVKNKWQVLFPHEPFNYLFFDAIFNEQYRAEEKFNHIVFIFTGLAIFIACLGLFGLTLFTAECRTKEIGIRKVLGASVPGIMGLLSKELLKWVVIANLVALPIAWLVMHRWLENFAFHIHIHWWTLALASLLVFIIAMVTVSGQAIRAAVINPVESLRYE